MFKQQQIAGNIEMQHIVEHKDSFAMRMDKILPHGISGYLKSNLKE